MSLYGALYSGVSGLTAQSSAMGAISDNITNVSTIGYKNTDINFKTLVTTQTSSTFYSAGGVQSAPRQAVDVQGLLQASTSQTDIAISGGGFFVVNANNTPGVSDPYFYTRAGSFKQDSEGFLANAAGYYLQGWPTDASGNIVPANSALAETNLNVISSDYLQTINLSRVAGSAAPTTQIAIGANLPATAVKGENYSTDVEFFDTLGTPGTMSYNYTRTGTDNQWDIEVKPPSGTAALRAYDNDGLVYDSWGQIEFTDRPAEGSTVTIDGNVYEFDSAGDGAQIAGAIAVNTSGNTTVAEDVSTFLTALQTQDSDFTVTNQRAFINPNNATQLYFHEDGTDAIVVDASTLLNAAGSAITKQRTPFSVAKQDAKYSPYEQFTLTTVPDNTDTLTINGKVYTFDNTGAEVPLDGDLVINTNGGVLADIVADIVQAVQANDPNYAVGGDTVRSRASNGLGAAAKETLMISSIPGQTVNVSWTTVVTNFNDVAKPPATAARTSPVSIDTTSGLIFSTSGAPTAINMAKVELTGFNSGAANMDDDPNNTPRIKLDFSDMAQFGSEFSPEFIQKDGSRFGTFAGVSISPEGAVVALFSNGDTRQVFQLPVATFTNPNGLGSRSGNVWNATEFSGDYTLRNAGSGSAGVVTQGSLESSTVDIGEEFTNMIVVQRAYSASTKIISTADQMLEELMRVKR